MGRDKRLTEGPRPNRALADLYKQFEDLCEIEGQGAADEGDLCRLRHEMTEACMTGDGARFLAALGEAMWRRDGETTSDNQMH